jgi:hypothetical protein
MTILSVVPDTLSEKMEWRTDIIRTRDGTEQRSSIRTDPRLMVSLGYPVLSEKNRYEFNRLIKQFYEGSIEIPLWQYATRVTATSSSGDSTLSYDFDMSPILVGGKIAVLDRSFRYKGYGVVSSYSSGGVTLTAPIGFTVNSTDHVCPLQSMLIGDSTVITINSKLSDAGFDGTIYTGYAFEIDSSFSLTMYDGFPVLDKRPKTGSESNSILREIIDFETGPSDIFIHGDHLDVSFDRVYRYDRYYTDEIKFWRKFLNTVRGSWKPFLVSSWMEDFGVTTLAQNSSTFTARTGEYVDFDFNIEAFRRIQIEYDDGTYSYHKITGYTDISGGRRFDITPNTPNDAKVASFRKISRLLKAYLGDTVECRHEHLHTEITVSINSTDFG